MTAEELLAGGTVVVVAPHGDDELLGCGATLAALSGRARVHVVYATDGAASPSPPLPWRRVDRGALARQRRDEAIQATSILGVPRPNVHFLDLPDGTLRWRGSSLERRLGAAVDEIRPDHLLVPFRFDRHPDHLAVNRAARRLVASRPLPGRALEYFVYTRWKLLPEGDVRAYLDEGLLVVSGAGEVARSLKRRALDACASQTTRFYDWQARPNLTPEFLDRACADPERFVDLASPTPALIPRRRAWIRLAHAVEPGLKRGKDRVAAALRVGR